MSRRVGETRVTSSPIAFSIVNGIAFRAIGQPLGHALAQMRGQAVHVAGSLAVDRWQGSERVQLRIMYVAMPDPGPATIR